MRILIVTSTFLPTVAGAEMAVHNLAEGLVALGHSVLVCAPEPSSVRPHKHTYELVRYRVPRGLGRLRIAPWWIHRFLASAVKNWRPDIVRACRFIWNSRS